MKNINLVILALIGMLAFQACEGPAGPQGPPGMDGEPGIIIVGQTFEVEVDFTEANNFANFLEFTEPLEDGDGVLVYMLEENPATEDAAGWRLLPQTFYFEDGILVYNFDYTLNDVSIFLDNSPIDFLALDPYWTNGVLFRVIVIPSDLINARIDYSDYKGTMDLLNISEEDFVRVESRK
ncbi:hypothetical protein LZF95_22050 [Algoriphagus sp. AGSA1]|uniref:hypothetical protein n=1 Tax=Algoriphagus sp. AGSA1 TaxID=2907213 RepID=UPI001F2F2431|nr:hypothetical protein [Algoriphagus sp. AGSA1]MCE7057380.1 hypothetical protein [Algoriphagus sp. AGSA1]